MYYNRSLGVHESRSQGMYVIEELITDLVLVLVNLVIVSVESVVKTA